MNDKHSAHRRGKTVNPPKTIQYEHFELTARPIPLASGKWTTEVRIRRNAVVRPFTAADEFNTEDEAILHSLNLGRQIIDGKIPEFSGVDVLP